MQYKIKNTTYKISFSFFALILYTITTSNNNIIRTILFSAILHETVHLIFIYLFSVAPEMVSFNLLGANIKRGITTAFSPVPEIIINASAPVFNIITGVVFYLISEKFPGNEAFFSEISQVNIFLGCFNLIPFYTFDGGNVLKFCLIYFFNEKLTEQILTVASLLITIIFSFAAIHIFLNYSHNFSIIIMCVYMFISIIFKKQNTLDY